MEKYFDMMVDLYCKLADGTATYEEFNRFWSAIVTREKPALGTSAEDFYYEIQKRYNERRGI